jgi:superfamily II RNA helicase
MGLLSQEKRVELLARFDQLCQRFELTHERSAHEMRELVTQGIAFHHAGLLPTLKEVVEILFASRLIETLVTTETFALGINMPARSVVLDTLIKGPVHSKVPLSVRELHQMAGRAGRRGMDEEGFVYLRVNPWEIPFHTLTHLLHGKPERVVSRFNSTYATILNLYRAYRLKLLPFYQQTFHAFQSPQADQRETFGLIDRKLSLLKEWRYVTAEGLTPKGIFASGLYGYELILSELFDSDWLDTLDLTDLGIFLLGMVFEPRRGLFQVKLPRRVRTLSSQAEEVLKAIRGQERRFRIIPLTKGPAFQLSAAMEMWLGGARFERVVQAMNVDEGELIRYFRMTLQLARSLATDSGASPALKEKSWQLFKKINRDPVDAEAELRRSL